MSRASDYPPDWSQTAFTIKARADWTCEACGTKHGPPPAMLTVHHLDRNTANSDPENLIAACQRCHLRAEHWAIAGETLTREEAIGRLEAAAEEERRQRSLF